MGPISSDIFIWLINYKDFSPNDWFLIKSLLSPPQVLELEEYPMETVRRQRAITDLTVRFVLAKYLHKKFNEWEFERSPLGKPHVTRPLKNKFDFSVSHVDGYIAVVYQPALRIGVDMELTSRGTILSGVAKEFLSTKELQKFNQIPREKQNEFLLGHWTLKEAISKAIGLGFHLPFKSLTLDFATSGIPKIESSSLKKYDPLAHQEWELRLLRPNDELQLALAVEIKGQVVPMNINFQAVSHKHVITSCLRQLDEVSKENF